MIISNIKVDLIDSMGSDLSVTNSARVSFAKEVKEFDLVKDVKLINYLAKHGHWSPFAHCFASFRIKVPIFVARQLAKHQIGLSINEESRRYISDEPEFYFPKEWRGKPINAKQGSSDEIIKTLGTNMFCQPITPHSILVDICVKALREYELMIEADISPEQARMLLPQNTITNFIWSGSLYAFARVCNLRLDSHAQYETRNVAELIAKEMVMLFPHSWNALISGDK